jgi:multiple sugar transport system permease protein
MTVSRRTLLADIGTYASYVVIFLFFMGPLAWLLSLSIRTQAEIFVSDLG